MAGRSRAGGNALYLILQGILGSVLGLAQMKIFTVYLSTEGYDLYLVMRGLAMLLTSVAVMGLPQLALRFLPQFETRGMRKRILRFSGLLLLGMTLTGLATGALAWHWQLPLTGRIGAVTGELPLMRQVLLLAAAMALTELVFSLYQGMRRMGPMAVVDILCLGGLSIHLLVARNALTPGLALDLFSVYFLIRCAVLLLLFPRILPAREKEQTEHPAPRITRSDLVNYWVLSLPLRWVALAYFELDRYVLGLVAIELVHLFHVSARVTGVSKRFLAAPVISLQAEMSRFYEERREAELPAHLQLFIRTQFAVSVWLAMLIFLLARPLVLLLSTDLYLATLPLLYILLITLPLSSFIASLEAAFRGLNGLRVVLVGNVLWALTYYGSMLYFVGRWGLIGLGLAQLMGLGLQVAWVLLCAERRGWLLGLWPRLARSFPWLLMPLLPSLGGAWLCSGGDLGRLSPGGIILGLVLLLLCSLLVLRGEGLLRESEKRWFLSHLPLPPFRAWLGRLMGLSEVNG